MKIAVTSQGTESNSLVDQRFGRAYCFMIFDDDNKTWSSIDNTQNKQSAQGAGIQAAAHIVNEGCSVLITGHCGPKAFAVLEKAGIAVHSTEEKSVEDAVMQYKAGKCKPLLQADTEGHW